MLEPPPLSTIDGAALFLDFDGTLVELAATPDAIAVSPDLAPMLRRLHRRLAGRLALVSGRAVADVERYLDCSGLAVSGSHGLELRFGSGLLSRPLVPDGLSRARAEARRFADAHGLLLEEKPAGFAIHYRQAPEQADRVLSFLAELAEREGFHVQRGKMVAELHPVGIDKGDAVRTIMKEPEFAGARPLFVGDDLTDEHAFRAADALGGAGILVGPERETAACWRLQDVAAVARWLDEAAS